MEVLKPLAHYNLIGGMLNELPAYLSACTTYSGVIDMSDPAAFTLAILQFWRNVGKNFPTWSKAARIIFALSPSSAPAERVFSVLKRLFGETRSQTLADMVEGSLLLNFNNVKRRSEKEAGF
jgi:hypothetical protein